MELVMGREWRQLGKSRLSRHEPKLVAKLGRVDDVGIAVLGEKRFFRFFGLLEKLVMLIASRRLMGE